MIFNLNNPKEVEDKRDAEDKKDFYIMKTKYGGKDGIYESLTNKGGYYLPPFHETNMKFLVAILKG